jgi:hypothetical protein
MNVKKNIGLLSLLAGCIGILLLVLTSIFGINGLPIIGLLLIVAAIVGGIVDGLMNRLPPRVRHDEDTPGTRLDKGQLPPSSYIPGPK